MVEGKKIIFLSIRTATIICKSDCLFLTLNKNSFDRVVGEVER